MASVLSTLFPSFYPSHGRGNACKSWRKHTLGCLHLRWSNGKSACGEGKELPPGLCFLPWHMSTFAQQTSLDLWSFPALPSALSCPPVDSRRNTGEQGCDQLFPVLPAATSSCLCVPWLLLVTQRDPLRLEVTFQNCTPQSLLHTGFYKLYLPHVQGWHPCFQGRWGAQASHCLWLSAWPLLNKQLLALVPPLHCLQILPW